MKEDHLSITPVTVVLVQVLDIGHRVLDIIIHLLSVLDQDLLLGEDPQSHGTDQVIDHQGDHLHPLLCHLHPRLHVIILQDIMRDTTDLDIKVIEDIMQVHQEIFIMTVTELHLHLRHQDIDHDLHLLHQDVDHCLHLDTDHDLHIITDQAVTMRSDTTITERRLPMMLPRFPGIKEPHP